MAFGITVHRRADDALYRMELDVRSEAFDGWIKECQARWIYEKPLGSDGTVFDLWHVPAHELGLPLLGSIYQDGLRVEGPQLTDLSRELEAFWARADFSRAAPRSAPTIHPDGVEEVRLAPLEEHLRERLGYFREAIRVAAGCDGVVVIS
jgi:hypothetical protein